MSGKNNDGPRKSLERAIEIIGSQSALARICGVKQGHVWAWLNKTGRCPAKHVLTVEEVTAGEITRHQLRPDLYPDTVPPVAIQDTDKDAIPMNKPRKKSKSKSKSKSKKGALKIAIYGAGAIGGYLGVQLSLAGHDVSLIARGEHLKAMM